MRILGYRVSVKGMSLFDRHFKTHQLSRTRIIPEYRNKYGPLYRVFCGSIPEMFDICLFANFVVTEYISAS